MYSLTSFFLWLIQSFVVLTQFSLAVTEIFLIWILQRTSSFFSSFSRSSNPVSKRANELQEILSKSISKNEYFDSLTKYEQSIPDIELWKNRLASKDYDYKLLLQTVYELSKARKHRDYLHLVQILRSLFVDGHFFTNIHHDSLFQVSLLDTKLLINVFFDEIDKCLEELMELNTLKRSTKIAFFQSLLQALGGNTALALSGGGSFSIFHLGVVKTLVQEKILPKFISGTSGGSILVAYLGLKTDAQLIDLFSANGSMSSERIYDELLSRPFFDAIPVQLTRFFTSLLFEKQPSMIDSTKFQTTLISLLGYETFLSAYRKSEGRVINITITVYNDTMKTSTPFLLNYITAPNVYLYSAVAASCALPGFMKPVVLLQQLQTKSLSSVSSRTSSKLETPVPFHHRSSAFTYLDGSMHSDIPRHQLKSYFHIRRIITSQANPHILPFLSLQPSNLHEKEHLPHSSTDSSSSSKRAASTSNFFSLMSKFISSLQYYLTLNIQHRATYLSTMKLLPLLFGADTSGLLLQEYEGDVTIKLPLTSVSSMHRALIQPSKQECLELILLGERSTWPKLKQIKCMVAIENKVKSCIEHLLHGSDKQKSKKRKSKWNEILSSIEEELATK
jgi:predicted acylesterase/phospholipase RssA